MADKSLGQHWLFDKQTLETIANYIETSSIDTIVEIGPGLGTLTREILKLGKPVTAIELDKRLLDDLENTFSDQNITFVHEDVLTFDFSKIEGTYSVCANIPYYLTSHLMRIFTELENKPTQAVLLIQKEVAERLAATPGHHSVLSISMQLWADIQLGTEVPAQLFSPPPKVDSQVVILDFLPAPRFDNVKEFLRVVKAGFSSPRKKLRSSLSAGLGVSVAQAESWLSGANIDKDRRAQTLTLEEWASLTSVIT